MDLKVGDRVQINDGTFFDLFEFLNLAYAIVDEIEPGCKILYLNDFQYKEGNLIPITGEAEEYLSRNRLLVGYRDVTKQNLSYPEFLPSAWDDVMEVI